MSTTATAALTVCLWCTEATTDAHAVCAGCREVGVVHRDELVGLTAVQVLNVEAEAAAAGAAVVPLV